MADDDRTPLTAAPRRDAPPTGSTPGATGASTGEDIHPRAREILAALTPDEKIAFLHQSQPAVERLGLAAFHTGAEALHGLAWLGTATVFPQPVGLAATWDTALVERVGAAAGAELLAAHREDPWVSRNVWAPVVNPLRHPRWGRNEEGLSEDPNLTAALASAYARGLKGPGHGWRTVPTLKHVLGYNNEDDRSLTSTSLRPRVLHEYELPAFLGPLRDGTAGAIMPSYNLVNGRPAHVRREVLDRLRDQTPGPLLVVSDAHAPTFLVELQRYFPDHAASHAAALRAGIDSFTDHGTDTGPTRERLHEALERGMITMDDVDRALLRVLHVRALTGELAGDPPPDGPPIDDLAHRELAREAATRAVVLLRNDGTLPLGRGTRLALVGPMARRVLTDWYSGTPAYTVTLADGLTERLGENAVTVADGDDRVVLRSTTTDAYVERAADGVLTATAAHAAAASPASWTDWGDGVVTLTDTATGLLWAAEHGPTTALTTRVGGWVAQESFAPRRHDDGTWSLRHLGSGRWLRVQTGTGALAAEGPDAASAERFVLHRTGGGLAEVAAAAAASDVTVVAVGNDPHLHGRETADRPHLRLPEPQAEIVRAAAGAGRPVVLAVVSSYPYVLDAAARSSAAVVWSSHAGQELGNALGDVLTGAAEPTGRLAQTWPECEADTGDLLDYDIIAGRSTYWYSEDEPLFAFGHGLSYTTTELASARLAEDRLGHDGELVVRVTVRNAGARPVREVVQVYTDSPTHPLPYPRRLAAWAHVRLEPGGAEDVELRFGADQLAIWDVRSSRSAVLTGEYRALVGTSAADVRAVLPLHVTGAELAPRSLAAGLAAADFDDQSAVVLGDRTPERGDCVQLAPGHSRGWVTFDDVMPARRLRLEVARQGGGPASVEAAVRGEASLPWRSLGPVVVPDGGRYDWSWAELRLPDMGEDPVQLRVTLGGAARLARLC
ncbi:glycoside hydrolase family 3 C-terminal domain-containing protein [Georgenia halophila]|uniref:Glycoside hydrolase family 3 C-terminal domain-containing protein n=1 Tax=Georgenia halophila TaxID=620889 RepID=A0ABP8KUE5_9MICO